tara:strand:+ start:276 stop:725 length:450 start_codon:yes stop_codon:yes gene_type:complete
MKTEYLVDVSDYHPLSFIHEYLEEHPDTYVAQIPKLPGYLILSTGYIYSNRCDKLLKTSACKGNHYYCRTRIKYDGTYRNYRIHRLVAEAFIHNPKNLTDVDHKNGNRSDNRLENIRWLSHKDNMNNLECHRGKKAMLEDCNEASVFVK